MLDEEEEEEEGWMLSAPGGILGLLMARRGSEKQVVYRQKTEYITRNPEYSLEKTNNFFFRFLILTHKFVPQESRTFRGENE